jgi:hypothetical protein
MNESAIKEVLRKDSRVRELITARAFQIYQSRSSEEGSPEEDWRQAEQEIIEDLAGKLVEAEAESWQIAAQGEPELQEARSFATLTGFMLANDSLPTRADLFDTRYYTIGLSYITGMFKIGRRLEEDSFLRYFSNDDAVVRALFYRLRTDPSSLYAVKERTGDLSIKFKNDEEHRAYLAYAESSARRLFGLFKRMLMGEPSAV